MKRKEMREGKEKGQNDGGQVRKELTIWSNLYKHIYDNKDVYRKGSRYL
jgi:hypothetical protein